MTTTSTTTTKTAAPTRVAKRPATKSTDKPATRTAKKPTAPKADEPVKVAKPRVAKKAAEKVAPVAPVKEPRVAKKATATKTAPKKVAKPADVEVTKFAFLIDGEVQETKEFVSVEDAKSHAESLLNGTLKKGWKVSWKGNRGGYTATVANSRGTTVDESAVVIKRTAEDGSVPTPKVKAEPRGFDEFGYRNGSDSSIAAHILMEGGASRGDINEKVAEAIKAANNGSLTTRSGSEKVIPTIVGNVVMKLQRDKGYKVQSTWRLVPPTK